MSIQEGLMSAERTPVLADSDQPKPRRRTIECLGDRILVCQADEKKTMRHGDLELEAPQKYQEKPTEGEVVGCGPDVTRINVGDTILFHLFSGLKLPEDYGKNLVLMGENEIVARLHWG